MFVNIIIHGLPIPWKAPYVGSRGAYSPRYNEMKIIKSIIREQYSGPIIDEAICVEITFYMPIAKSTSKKKRLMMLSGQIRPTSTPDVGNLEKLYHDCLQEIVITNDSKIVDARATKFYSDNPRTEISIRTI